MPFEPVILFFLLGLLAGLARSDLKIPAVLYEPLSIFLLLAIGLKGGVELARQSLAELLLPALVMTYVCMSYVFISPLMCGMRDRAAAYLLGGALTLAILITMIFKMRRDAKSIS